MRPETLGAHRFQHNMKCPADRPADGLAVDNGSEGGSVCPRAWSGARGHVWSSIMQRAVAKDKYTFLKTEVLAWELDSLVSPEQGAAILERYLPLERTGRIISILAVFGAILVGVGVLLFIGANWHHMSVVIKTALIAGSVIASYAAGWYLKSGAGNRPRVGEAMLLLGSLLYGCGIWLIAQIFRLEVEPSSGLLLWGAGVLPTAIVAESGASAVLGAVICAVWGLGESRTLVEFSTSAGAGLAAAYWVRSPWSVAVALASGALWMVVRSDTGPFGLALLGIASFAWYVWHARSRRWSRLSWPYLFVGAIAGMSGLIAFTSPELVKFSWNSEGTLHVLVTLVNALVAMACMFSSKADVSREALGCGVALSGTIAMLLVKDATMSVICSNLLLLCIIFGLMIYGVNKLESTGLVSITVIFLVTDIFWRYNDSYFRMLDRSMFFVIGGILLLAAGYIIEQGRRRAIQTRAGCTPTGAG
jgi:uncharacterized membrane protein